MAHGETPDSSHGRCSLASPGEWQRPVGRPSISGAQWQPCFRRARGPRTQPPVADSPGLRTRRDHSRLATQTPNSWRQLQTSRFARSSRIGHRRRDKASYVDAPRRCISSTSTPKRDAQRSRPLTLPGRTGECRHARPAPPPWEPAQVARRPRHPALRRRRAPGAAPAIQTRPTFAASCTARASTPTDRRRPGAQPTAHRRSLP